MSTANPQDYAYWIAALAGQRPPVQEGNLRPGYYFEKSRHQNGGAAPQRIPVAIWRGEDGRIVARWGADSSFQKIEGEVELADLWLKVAARPVSEEAYEAAFATGKWPDDLPDEAFAPPKVAGSNAPIDPMEEYRDQIEAASKAADGITSITEADEGKVQGLRSRLLELVRTANKERESLVAPHLAAQRAVNSAWNPLIARAKDGADRLVAMLNAYIRDRDRKAQEAARAVEEANRVAQARAAMAGQPAPAPVAVAAPPKVQVATSYGRKAAVVTVRGAKVTDVRAFVTSLLDSGDTPLRDFLADRATKLAKDGAVAIPGVEITEERQVR